MGRKVVHSVNTVLTIPSEKTILILFETLLGDKDIFYSIIFKLSIFIVSKSAIWRNRSYNVIILPLAGPILAMM